MNGVTVTVEDESGEHRSVIDAVLAENVEMNRHIDENGELSEPHPHWWFNACVGGEEAAEEVANAIYEKAGHRFPLTVTLDWSDAFGGEEDFEDIPEDYHFD